jgi:flagellar hook assembly protein FlgD
VKTLIDDDGDGRIVWDGRNESGDEVATGVYIGNIEANGKNKIKIAVEK